MNKNSLKAAVKKYQPYAENPDELKELLSQDEKGYSDEEIEEIIAELTGGETPGEPEPPIPSFDLKNLTGSGLIKAVEALQSLNWNQQYVFEVYRIETTKAPRYEGVPGSPVDITGVRIKDSTPVMTTKVDAKTANLMNGIVTAKLNDGRTVVTGAQFTNTNKIYLPKL